MSGVLRLFQGMRREDIRPPNPAAMKADFRPDIEGLRAVAILLVVAFHVGIPVVPGGYVGVDIFFVVSGYLITGLLIHELETSGRLSLLQFYARRARRLLPASILTLIATLIAGYFLLSPVERLLHARTSFAAALYVSNIWFQRQASDYFAPDNNENPILHTWSLSVEEQFYLVWPLLVLASFSLVSSKQALLKLVAAITVGSFASSLWLSASDQSWAFFASPMRAWEFGMGGIAAMLPASCLLRLDRYRRPLMWLGLLLILLGAVLLDATAAFPSKATLVPVLGTVLVLIAGAGLSPGGSAGSVLTARPLQLIGRLSYSWYLWHWPILFFGTVLIPFLTLPHRIGLAALSLGVAVTSYFLVENPIRFHNDLKVRPVLTLVLAAAMTAAAAAGSRLANAAATVAASTPMQRAIVDASFGSPRLLHDSGCFLSYADERPPECSFGNPQSSTVLALFGDSHAAQWFPAFEAIANQRGWRLVAFTKAGCPTPGVAIVRWTKKNLAYPECSTWRDAALRRIVELNPALVIIGNSDGHVTGQDLEFTSRLSLEQWRVGTQSTLEKLNAAHIPTLMLRDTPGMRFDVLKCLSRVEAGSLPIAACEVDRRIALRDDVFRVVKEVAGNLPHVATLDLSNFICDEHVCPPMRGKRIVYRDSSHITDSFARSLADDINPLLLPSMKNE